MQNDNVDKTGEGIYRRASLSLNEVTFNGNDGIFFERDKDAKKDEQTGKFPKVQLTQDGESLNVVFLKIRRVLSSFSKKQGASMRTNEHNHKGETVVLYANGGKEYGLATALREKYPQLKTQQIIYCLVPNPLAENPIAEGRIVRLVVKGSSLGSDYKHPAGVLKFYDYLQSFSADEKLKMFITELKPVKEEGPQGDYYAMSFAKGARLNDKEVVEVDKMIDDLHERITAIDMRLSSNMAKPAPQDDTPLPEEEMPTIQVGEDEEE